MIAIRSLRKRQLWRRVLAALTLSGLAASSALAQSFRAEREEVPSTAARFLVTKLAETRPGVKSLRRTSSFLGTLKGQSGVQLAFVLDGTESMGTELDSLKREIGPIVENLKDQVEGAPFSVSIAIVVYRDTKAPSGTVSMVLPNFSEDLIEIANKIDEIRVETGAPYFDERVDEGIQAALTKLPWSDKPDVSRWLILCGDAPPYPESTEHRRHSLQDLIKLAKDKKVAVYGLSVNSGTTSAIADKIKATSTDLRPEFSQFMTRLADATGGKTRNLWDREALLSEIKQKPITIPMESISDAEIAAARKNLDVPASIAVLPPALNGMPQFAAGSEAALAATAAQHALANLGFAVRGPATLEALYQAASSSGVEQDKAIQRLVEKLGVEYVFSGAIQPDAAGDGKFTFALSRWDANSRTPIQLASWSEKSPSAAPEQVGTVIKKLLELGAKLGKPGLEKLSTVLAKAPKEEYLARDTRARRAMLSAMYAIEKSLAAETPRSAGSAASGQVDAATLLKTAQSELQAAAALETDNPVVELLLSLVYYNLSQMDDSGDEYHQQFVHLQRAYDLRDKPEFENSVFRREIEAYHALLIDKDIPKAVTAFTAIASDKARESSNSALRARWMLAGMYFGDWGSRVYSPEIVDLKKAREQVVTILARWPQLPEADFYRRCLQGSRNGEAQIPLVASTAMSGP